jgi:hypothetical protein
MAFQCLPVFLNGFWTQFLICKYNKLRYEHTISFKLSHKVLQIGEGGAFGAPTFQDTINVY